MSSDYQHPADPRAQGEEQAELSGQPGSKVQSPVNIRIVYRVSCQCAQRGLSDQGHALEYVMSVVPERQIDLDKFDELLRDYLEDSRVVPEEFEHAYIHEVYRGEVFAGIMTSLYKLGYEGEKIEVVDIPGQGESPGDDWDVDLSGSDGSDRMEAGEPGEYGEDYGDEDEDEDEAEARKEDSKKIEEAQTWFLQQWDDNRGRIIPDVPFRLILNFFGVPDLYLVPGETAAQERIKGDLWGEEGR